MSMRRWIADDGLAWGLAGVAFAGSYSHLVALGQAHGVGGALAYTTAGCVDAIVAMAARERQRDKRSGRQHRGLTSWPVVVLVGGVTLTLAGNLARAQHSPWGWVMADIPALALLLAISMIERRNTDAAHRQRGADRQEHRHPDRQPLTAVSSPVQAPVVASVVTPPRAAPAGTNVVDIAPRGNATTVMRRFWEREVAQGRIPTGADLVRAAGLSPSSSLGRQNAAKWRGELSEEATG
jgi:MFS family permease